MNRNRQRNMLTHTWTQACYKFIKGSFSEAINKDAGIYNLKVGRLMKEMRKVKRVNIRE